MFVVMVSVFVVLDLLVDDCWLLVFVVIVSVSVVCVVRLFVVCSRFVSCGLPAL